MKHVRNALIRSSIPFGVTLIIALWMNSQRMDIRSVIFGGLIGMILAASSVIYDMDGWSVKKQSVIHFITMAITLLPCLIFSGWYTLKTFTDLMVLLGSFLLSGLALWLFFYFLFTRVIK